MSVISFNLIELMLFEFPQLQNSILIDWYETIEPDLKCMVVPTFKELRNKIINNFVCYKWRNWFCYSPDRSEGPG